MAYYKAGDIIRLTRQASGMSQEELSFDICATQTLSRIENGKSKVKIETYCRLMDKMGRYGEKIYGICTTEEMEILQERILLENAITKGQYDLAKEYIHILEHKSFHNDVNKQYVLRMKLILKILKKEISEKEFIEKMESILKITVSNYEKYLLNDDIYPFTENEIEILMNIAAYSYRVGNTYKSLNIYKMLLKCLDCNYMNGRKLQHIKFVTLRNLSSLYGNIGEYEKSNEIAEKILKSAIEDDYGYIIPIVLEDMAWNLRKKKISPEEKNVIKRKMRQAYFIAAARKDNKNKEIIRKSYKETFDEDLWN